MDPGLLLGQVAQLVHLPLQLRNGGRALETLAAAAAQLSSCHHRGHGQRRARPRAGA